MRELDYYDLGLMDYSKAWELQRKTFELRRNKDIPDTLYMLEHPHTYTLGKVADRKNLIGSEEYLRENAISVYDIDRGGDITYHGPGQIVGYPILDLSEWKQDTHLYLRSIEQVIILTCRDYGLDAGRIEKLTGVWIEERKIAAIGIKVSRWITMHGFAFNVNTDLSLFKGIIPCGITDKSVTSLSMELGGKVDLGAVKERLLENFKKVFGYETIRISQANYHPFREEGLS
ncbi:MAG: lipoyl(octanoyl) transferase LipB [Ignavibacteria bacterium]|jgi:lipoyl(octanoyl) transferase|nr:lipoyl(octanoyl) transferase LipB [Ignavibacteria bacterium]MCU7501592.1 lipoyl(octanoyl) transferase LipB [Ignavibacteria bacterium]MCU7517129.1 lipoyl(octanoyl) transferase LipB [Ignavibacteria bacterium]